MEKKIRNFCIIAHIDHWKSTLADRMLEITWTIRNIDHWQLLDKMDLEQERGITIKLTPVRMDWKWYQFNLIDTPWHADFQYEVSRSLEAVEWVILLVDATQWIQAQTLSTLYMAIEQDLDIIPVLNKIDLPSANIERVSLELEHLLWIDRKNILSISAKTWLNVELVLDKIIEDIKCPVMSKQEVLSWISRALIFDSVYDPYRWVVSYVKIFNWMFDNNSKLKLVYSDTVISPTEVGFFSPDYKSCWSLSEWEIWYIVTWEKSVRNAKIWDTILKFDNELKKKSDIDFKKLTIPWFKTVKPFVYAWIYPIDTNDYQKLKSSLWKLVLNDSSLEYELEESNVLWFWFRCWFLWLLHMDIIKERLFREYGVDTIFTLPTVAYLLKSKNLSIDVIKIWKNIKDIKMLNLESYVLKIEKSDTNQNFDLLKPRIVVKSWADMVDWNIEKIYEPVAEVEIVGNQEFSWNIMELCQKYRWKLLNMEQLDKNRMIWKYDIPLWELIVDFYDKLKSATKWYATMNYEFKKYIESDLVKLNIFVNNEQVEALSWIVHKEKAYYFWRELVKKLKELIPKHMFSIPIQAWIWNKIIARENISAMKKDVIAKCYWWDITRKRKLLQKQKEWKKKMKMIWKVQIPSDVFVNIIKK